MCQRPLRGHGRFNRPRMPSGGLVWARRIRLCAWSEFTEWGSASGGGVSQTANPSEMPSVATDPWGHPVLAWVDKSEIYVKRWTGSAWEEVGAGSASGGGISNTEGSSNTPSLALDPMGSPAVVAWRDSSSGRHEIYVKRFDGTTWTELEGSASGGGVSRSGASSLSPALTIDAHNRVCVAWSEYGHKAHQILLRCAHWP